MGFNTNLIIVTILISMSFFILSAGILEIATNYSVPVDADLQDTFNEYAETQSTFEETQQIIQGGDVNPEGQDQAVYKNVIVAGKQVQQQGDIFINFLGKITKYIPMDTIIIAMLTTIIFVLILFGFVTMITKQGP